MKLSNKNLLYSILLAAVLLLFLVGYFIWMLPSLYVEHQMNQNLDSIVEQQKTYMEQGNYDGIIVQNPMAAITIEIPKEGNCILLTNQMGSAKLTAVDERLSQTLQEILEMTRNINKKENGNKSKDFLSGETLNRWKENMKDMFGGTTKLPFDLEILHTDKLTEYASEFSKIHLIDGILVVEAGVTDSKNQYVNYIAVQEKDGGLVASFLPIVTPQMKDIRPVVMQSLPMLGAVVLLLVLLFSQIYSKGIVSPMVNLENATKGLMDSACKIKGIPKEMKSRRDELGLLAQSVDELYQQLQESYQELKIKNEALQEENKRQEVFLRASSHQLKTPIAAALLLLEGMIGKIGKYKDTETYLPKVKEQLLSMRKMVEDILYLSRCEKNIQSQELDLVMLTNKVLNSYQVISLDKELQIKLEGEKNIIISTDPEILTKIIDNLISNAVKYTPSKESIIVAFKKNMLQIHNTGITIPEDILPNIFDPFVKGNHVEKSHGLGLYIASYYAELLGFELSMQNAEGGVTTTLIFT